MALTSITKAVTRISVIEGLISEKLHSGQASIDYLEIGVGEGLTIKDIMKKFNAVVYSGGVNKGEEGEEGAEADKGDLTPLEDDDLTPRASQVNIVSVDPYRQQDHVYGDYIMESGQSTLPKTLTSILSYREFSVNFFEQIAARLGITYDIIFLDGSHRASDILSDLYNIVKYNLLKTSGIIIINGVYPPTLEAQGDVRTGELWCGTAWKVLSLLADTNTNQNITFYSTATDGGLLFIDKSVNIFINELENLYGTMETVINTIDELYLTNKYVEQFLSMVTKESDKYKYCSDMDFVSRLGIDDYFTE